MVFVTSRSQRALRSDILSCMVATSCLLFPGAGDFEVPSIEQQVGGGKISTMKAVYWDRFFQRVASGIRTGMSVLLIGLLLQFAKGLKEFMYFTTFAPVMAISTCDATVGKVTRNALTVAVISALNACTSMIVWRFIRPPMHFAVAIACIGIFSFIISYPTRVHLLARKIGLAHLGILYVRAHVDPDMDIVKLPLKLLFSTTLGSACAVVAITVPYPRLAVWEVLRCANSTAHTTSELFKAAVSAFSAHDASSFSAISLHSKMLRTAVEGNLAELREKQAEIWWEVRATCSKRSRFTNMTKGLYGLSMHLTGMQMALQSGFVLQCPAVMRKVLEEPLMRVADYCSRILEIATKTLTSCSLCTGAKTLNCGERKSLMDEGKLTLIVFDNAVLEARKIAYYTPATEEAIQKRDVDPSTNTPESILLGTSNDMVVPMHQRFMARLTANFFLFNLRLYFIETMFLVDSDFRIFTTMHEVAGVRLKNWIPARLPRFSMLSSYPVFYDNEARPKTCIDISVIEEEVTEATGNDSLDVSSTCHPLHGQCPHCKPGLHSSQKTELVSDSWKWLRLLVNPSQVQVVKSCKVSVIMMLATGLGLLALPNDSHACWAPITVSFIIGNLQGGAFRLASLRIQGTAVGSIFGYLVVSGLYKYKHALPFILAVWVAMSDYIRYSKTHGYSGLVSALTAAILMLGDFEGKDIKTFTLDRIAMTFIGVASFVLVETVLMPERAVRLVREELLQSMTRLRDCVAAIVTIYTRQGCIKCRSLAVDDMRKLEQQLRAGLVAQTDLRTEAVLEPELWFVPFPGEVYSKLICTQKRMLDLLFFMVCSLQASTQDCLDEHMQKLLKPLGSSLTALESEVLSTVDSLQKLLQKTKTSWEWLPDLNVLHAFRYCRSRTACGGDAENVRTPSPRTRHRHTIFEPSRKASRALLALGHRRRSIGGTPQRLKTTMDRFEQTFESVLEEILTAHNKTVEAVGGDGHVVGTSVMFSISSLSFCLHSLLVETVDLERYIWELLQAENPLSIADFWDEFGLASQMYRQQPEDEEQQRPQHINSF